MQDGDIVYTPNNFVNAIQELPVSFTPKNKFMYTKSLFVCFIAYFFSILFGFFSLTYIDLGHLWLDILLAHIVATVVIFIFSVIYKCSSLYDPFWSVIPFPIFLYLVIYPEVNETSSLRFILIGLPITYYVFRLTWNWLKTWPDWKRKISDI